VSNGVSPVLITRIATGIELSPFSSVVISPRPCCSSIRAINVGVAVGVYVGDGVFVGVAVGEGVSVEDGVGVGVSVFVGIGDGTGEGVLVKATVGVIACAS
jgi:hypothetical protein